MPFEYDPAQDLRFLATRRKSREWLRGHAIDLAHQSRLERSDLPFIYRLKEYILPADSKTSFGPTLESGKDRFLKREDGTYFDREKHQKLYDAAEDIINEHWNEVYNATIPTQNAVDAFKTIRTNALIRLNAQNLAPEAQIAALDKDKRYKKDVNKFLNRYNT